MKLFVSYRRKSWGFTQYLAEKLERRLDAEIFIDYEGIDETHFANSIMRHLRGSDAVLLIVSDLTFAPQLIFRDEDWVRREIRTALEEKIPIINVFVDGQSFPAELPPDIAAIRQMQGVNFYPEYFTPALIKLVGFITKATPIKSLKPLNRDKQVRRGLREMKQGLAKLKSGKGNVNELYAEFQSYIAWMEELFEMDLPGHSAKRQPEQAQTLYMSMKMLEDMLNRVGPSQELLTRRAKEPSPNWIDTLREQLTRAPKKNSLHGLSHLSRLADERPPGEPTDWMFPQQPADLPP